jgi:ectoine hydroxylase-related dioxygenase (phytanoyl-CoA dioxygenase family)
MRSHSLTRGFLHLPNLCVHAQIAGGHKARFPYQGPGTDFAGEATAIDHPLCTHVALSAGDVIIFNARCTPHGVLAWNGARERRCVIQFFNPAYAKLTPGQLLGTASRNRAAVNGGRQRPPGWDLSEAMFATMWSDLGISNEEDYRRYKAGVGFGDHVVGPAARL